MKNELYHYGIQGQKWGVRRYQNEDGSLTAEGKARLKGWGKKTDRKLMNEMSDRHKYVGKKFDKYTEKILKDKAAGKNISNRRIKKAVELGTEFRSLDYHAKNFDKYAKYNKNIQDAAAYGVMAGYGVYGGNVIRTTVKGNNVTQADRIFKHVTRILPSLAGLSAAKIVRSKSSYVNEGKKIVEKAKAETIADLKKHGVIDSNSNPVIKSRKINKMSGPSEGKFESKSKSGLILAGVIYGSYGALKAANAIKQYSDDRKIMKGKPDSFYKKVYSPDNKIFKDMKIKDIGGDWSEDLFNSMKRLKG